MEQKKVDAVGLPIHRITEEDIATLKAMFEDNPAAAKVLRKVMYPELTADEPIFMKNPLLLKANFDGLDKDQMVVEVITQKKLVNHVEGALSVIKHLVGEKTETPEQVIARLQKDSAK